MSRREAAAGKPLVCRRLLLLGDFAKFYDHFSIGFADGAQGQPIEQTDRPPHFLFALSLFLRGEADMRSSSSNETPLTLRLARVVKEDFFLLLLPLPRERRDELNQRREKKS